MYAATLLCIMISGGREMKFKEKLQILRTEMRISQEDLAAKLNITRQSVAKWENGFTQS